MLKRKTIFCVTMACCLALAGAAGAQDTDFSTFVTDSDDPVAPGSVVSYEVQVANAGPDDSPNPIILDIYLPMDVPVPFTEYLDADEDTRAAIVDAWFETANFLIDDNIWDPDVSGTYMGDSFNNACESMIVQPQELVLPAGTSGSFYYDTVVPSAGGVSGFAYDNSAGERTTVNYGVGGCNSVLFDDCAGIPCMGPRLTMHPATPAPVTAVNSEPGADNGGPAEGCGPLIDFPAGHIALIDRGTCSFSVKGDMATQAGASGVIIANSAALGSVTPTGDSVMTMGCTDAVCHSLITTIPAAFISYNDGEALKAAINGGGATGFMGVREETPEYQKTIGYIWESASNATDVDPDNDTYIETTTFGSVEPPPCTPIYVAAAAAGAGAGTSMWATDLGLNNSGDEALTYKFQFLPRGADNTDVAFTEEATLEPNANASFVNIWNLYTGGDGAGSINVCVSDPAAAGVISRTYNTSDMGTFGQSIVGMEGMAAAKMIGMGEKVRMGFLTENSAFRTNVGFMNAGASTITIEAEFFAADGTSLGTSSIDIPPYSNNQWNRAFRQATTDSVDLGYIDVWSDTADAMFLTYASVVDNNTDDPTTIWPFNTSQMVGGDSMTCTPYWIAAAASANGAGGTTWATDLGLSNLGSDPLTYWFQFLPRGADNTGVAMSDAFTLGGNQSIAYSDVWSMTGGQGSGSINVCVDNGDAAGITSRTYNIGDEGTFGQMIEGMRGSAPAKVATGEKVRLGYLFENETYRTNIGFMNSGSNSVTVMVEFFDMDGNSLGTKTDTILPYSSKQWNAAYTLPPIEAGNIAAGFADVWTNTADANFLTYASIVDNGTGDPTTVWPF